MTNTKKKISKNKKNNKDFCNCYNKDKCGGGIYGLGFVGAAIYYVSSATTFWLGVLGFLKAILWPAFMVYEILKYLG